MRILEMIEEPAPDLVEHPLERLQWEIAWYAHSEEYTEGDQLDRVTRVWRFLHFKVLRDPAVERAWQCCPEGVSRLLTLTVAHFPVHVGEGGVLDTYDWSYFVTDEEDDKVERLPRPEEEGE